jgi:hypothetical protein
LFLHPFPKICHMIMLEGSLLIVTVALHFE